VKKASKKKASPVRRSKPKLTDQQLAHTFGRAVNAGNATLARKLASEIKRRNPYGVYGIAGITVADLRTFETLTKKKRSWKQ
jgi:hypothetical protein